MSSAASHRLLQRQLRHALAEAGIQDLDSLPGCEIVKNLLEAVDATYHRLDDERFLLERSLQLASDELVERNCHLREELERRTETQDRMEAELRQRLQAESELHRTLFRLDEAQRIAELGYWQWDASEDAGFWSGQTAKMFGYDPSDPAPPPTVIIEMVHPEDRVVLNDAIRNTRSASLPEQHIRVWRRDGDERTLRVSGEIVRSAETGAIAQIHGVCMDVSAAIEHTRTLMIAKERAEEMLHMKTSLLENMSHEFRTPLTSIIGYAECLKVEVGAEQQSLVAAILRGGQRLFGTLNAILDLAQLDGGSYHLALVPVNVAAVAREAARDVLYLAETKGLDLRIEATAGQWVLADHSALLRVLSNLVGNAVKFTQEGFVSIEISDAGSHTSLRVTDSGVGIHSEFVPHLFEEFRQESTGLARRHEGNGLGLAITRRIVDLMGGMISVESEVGVGSVFEVLLPATAAELPGTHHAAPNNRAYGSPELNALLAH